MDILKYFRETKKDDIIRLTLDEAERDNLLNSLPEEFSLCYISKRKLSTLARQNRISEQEYFDTYCLPQIPGAGNIRSGDFGEMLCFYLVKDIAKSNGSNLEGPRKWRWKADKNKATQGADVVLFHRAEKQPSVNDRIEVIESKMKATGGRSRPISSAIIGSKEDKVKRLTKTLNWFDAKLAEEGKPCIREALERYRYPDIHGKYERVFHAIAIIDDSLVEAELEEDYEEPEDIVVRVLSMAQLKKAYERTYNSMKA